MLAHEEYCFVGFLFLCLFFVVPINYENKKEATITPDAIQAEDGVFAGMNRDGYKDAINRISSLNSSSGATYGITKFSLMSQDDFKKSYLTLKADRLTFASDLRYRKKREATFPNISGVADKIDWREKGVVSSVKTQSTCGACWAFSTVGILESVYAIKTGKLTDFSTQQVIDCATGNYGCHGGDTCSALRWMGSDDVHIYREKDYPLSLKTGFCRKKRAPGIKLANYTCSDLVGKEEEIVRLLSNHGPVAVAVDGLMWQDYLGGIIRFNCDTNLNHAAQIVGYDLIGPVPYYIVKNSWGTDFGIGGYLHIEIGKNLCGIARRVSSVDAAV